MVTKAADDLEAVRAVADTLEPFENDARERIIRWARERLGMGPAASRSAQSAGGSSDPETATSSSTAGGSEASTDIKSFVDQKQPKGDGQFAATVAYYYQFKAPPNQRKTSITKEALVEACRQVVRKQPASPVQVLVNAYRDGLFDRGAKGEYVLNSVGENLVAMTLPAKAGSRTGKVRKKAGAKKKTSIKTKAKGRKTSRR